jgi:hypothetical protein
VGALRLEEACKSGMLEEQSLKRNVVATCFPVNFQNFFVSKAFFPPLDNATHRVFSVTLIISAISLYNIPNALKWIASIRR